MGFITKYFMKNEGDKEFAIHIGTVYEFSKEKCIPRTGKLVSVSNGIATFDCSSNFNKHIVEIDIKQIHCMKLYDPS
jgi:hypothetical protein